MCPDAVNFTHRATYNFGLNPNSGGGYDHDHVLSTVWHGTVVYEPSENRSAIKFHSIRNTGESLGFGNLMRSLGVGFDGIHTNNLTLMLLCVLTLVPAYL